MNDSDFQPILRALGHDIQNSIGVILSGLELIEENPDNQELQKKYSQFAKKAAFHLSQTSRTLVHTGQYSADQKDHIKIPTLLDEAKTLAEFELKKRRITLHTTYTDSFTISGNESSLFLAFLHIIMYMANLIQKEGEITLHTVKNKIEFHSIQIVKLEPQSQHLEIAKTIITQHKGTLSLSSSTLKIEF